MIKLKKIMQSISIESWILKAFAIAMSEAANQSRNSVKKPGLLRRFASRNDETGIKTSKIRDGYI